MSRLRRLASLRLLRWCLMLCALPACGGPAKAHSPSGSRPDTARGGRLFDNWISEKKLGDVFRPDSAKTPELDGMGGPNRNGTLSDGFGRPLPNTGHDYRLKNLFGWDLRGSQGIYGPNHQKKSFVLAESLLDGPRTELLHPAQRHAEMLCLEHHADALGPQVVVEPAGDLRREPLLDLEVAREQLDDARQL